MNNYSFTLTEIETGINLQRAFLITALDSTYNSYILDYYKYAIEIVIDENISIEIYDIKENEKIFYCSFSGEYFENNDNYFTDDFLEITKDKCNSINSIINSTLNCDNFSLYDLIEKYL